MERQIHFHMLPSDHEDFLRFVRTKDDVAIILSKGESDEVLPIQELNADSFQVVYLWNRTILPRLKRTWIRDCGFYGISPLNLPILEFGTSMLTTWEERPALVQGRLYGIFDPDLEKPPGFEKWYNGLVRWIRTKYKKSPTNIGGYVGPEAYKFYEDGGFLLPNYRPPRTQWWLEEIGKQHSVKNT
jgi:hypothetical protein